MIESEVHGWVLDAYQRIKPFIRETPLEYSQYLSDLCQCKVYLKLENYQVTGSFKARGGLNKLMSLSQIQRENGVITASTGNHAAAVGYGLSISKSKGTVFMPENVSPIKIDNLRQFDNLEIKLFGKDSVESELAALTEATKSGKVYISPYNDQGVIGGQGTIGVELDKQLAHIDSILVPVGGGGLIAGIAGYIKTVRPEVDVVGCQPSNSAVMYHSIEAGRILEMASLPTCSDGTAGGIELDSITFPICQRNVDNFHLVEEDEIIQALGILLARHQILAEGAAGLSVASLIKHKQHYQGQNVVLIICGNKMGMGLLKAVTQQIAPEK